MNRKMYTIPSYRKCNLFILLSYSMQEIFYKFNPRREKETFSTNFLRREKYLSLLENHLNDNEIVILTWLRRIGKTSIMKLFIQELIEKYKVNSLHIFYISCDIYGLEKYSLLDLVREFRKIHGIKLTEQIYVFFDEITYKDSYQQQLKNLYDEWNIKIYATSSASSVLKDSKAFLTGRSRLLEVMPLDFDEYLLFKNIKISKAEWYLYEKYFEQYMSDGGIPEYVLNGEIGYIKALVDDIMYKDIIAYHNIKEKTIIKEFFLLLLERCGKPIGINKLANILWISPDTSTRFLWYFIDTYLFYLLPRCGKLNETIRSSKKLYCGDVGIKNAFLWFKDKWAVYENLIYLKLKKHTPCYYYQDETELDFIANKTLIEAKYGQELNEKQKKLFDKFPWKKHVIQWYEWYKAVDDILF